MFSFFNVPFLGGYQAPLFVCAQLAAEMLAIRGPKTAIASSDGYLFLFHASG
jgi:hypothetical protein